MMYNTTAYAGSSITQGYGFTEVIDAYETEAGGNKIRDFVYKAGGEPYTFKIDLPNGTYSVFVYSGNKMTENTLNFYFNEDSTNVHTQVTPEGVASDNYSGENTYTVEVTDRVLTITFWGDSSLGADAVTGALNSLEIKKINSSGEKAPEEENEEVPALKKPQITSAARVGKTKKYKIKWKADKSADGYLIQVSNKKSFPKGAYKTTVKKASCILKKKALGSSKRAYVRVRAYASANGEKVYGKWSKAKKIIIK